MGLFDEPLPERPNAKTDDEWRDRIRNKEFVNKQLKQRTQEKKEYSDEKSAADDDNTNQWLPTAPPTPIEDEPWFTG